MEIVPLQAVPSQKLTTIVNNQITTLQISQKSTGVFMDVYLNDELVIGGVICQNLNRIIRSEYLGFVGDFAFIDNQGTDDPYYTGLGDRFMLAYFLPSELIEVTG